MNKKILLGSIIAVVILVLVSFTGVVGYQTTKSTNIPQEEYIEEPISEIEDSNWLATLRMDFGEEIYNDKIEHVGSGDIVGIPIGDYYVHVLMDYECPSNRKIEITYRYYAELTDLFHPIMEIVFCDKNDSITITNGSNPPTFDIKYEKHLTEWWTWVMRLHINATLLVYEYIDGEWVQISEDYTNKQVNVFIYVYTNKSFNMNHHLIRFLERFPLLERFLTLLIE